MLLAFVFKTQVFLDLSRKIESKDKKIFLLVVVLTLPAKTKRTSFSYF